MTVAVVDDDPTSARTLVAHLHRYGRERGVEVAVRTYPDGADLIAGYDLSTDLLLLDVEMPQVDGLTAAARIRERDRDVAIVFLSHAAGHAIGGYAVGAQGYLVKPVQPLALDRELDRALDRGRRLAAHPVVLGDGALRVDTAEVVHLEAARQRVLVHTLAGPYTVPGPLKAREAELAGQGFFRCHHAFVVNLAHVVGVQHLTCRMRDRQEVPISRPRRSAFLAALTDHLAVRG